MIVARVLAAAGGLLASGGVLAGLAGEGGTEPYRPRLAFALAALGLAVAAALPVWLLASLLLLLVASRAPR